MKQITSAEFKNAVELDPAWATTLTEPIEIIDFCHMGKSKITHLSHLLHFTGRNVDGDVASFYECKNLKVAQGNFHGYVGFIDSGIEAIDPDKLIITQPDNIKTAASFYNCKNLKVAQGTFPGSVDFNKAGIEKIGKIEFKELHIRNCDKLTTIPEKFITTDMVIMDDRLRKQTKNEKKARDLFRQQKQEPVPEI